MICKLSRECSLYAHKGHGKVGYPKLIIYEKSLKEGDNESCTNLTMNLVNPKCFENQIRSLNDIGPVK